MGPRNHVLDGGPDLRGMENFDGGRAAHCKLREIPCVSGGDAAFCQITFPLVVPLPYRALATWHSDVFG